MASRHDHYDDPGYDYGNYQQGRGYEHDAEVMAINRLLEGKHFSHAVDIGGGYGRLSVVLANYADSVTLAVPSEKQLRLAERNLSGHPKITRRRMRADNLELANGSVDLAVMIRVLHHLPDPSAEFAEIHRILSGNGYAILEVANYGHVRNRMRHFAKRRAPVANNATFVNHNPKIIIRQLEHAGLNVERILSVSNLGSTKLKKIMPKSVLLAIEGLLQPTLANRYFGPSIFFLVRKIR